MFNSPKQLQGDVPETPALTSSFRLCCAVFHAAYGALVIEIYSWDETSRWRNKEAGTYSVNQRAPGFGRRRWLCLKLLYQCMRLYVKSSAEDWSETVQVLTLILCGGIVKEAQERGGGGGYWAVKLTTNLRKNEKKKNNQLWVERLLFLQEGKGDAMHSLSAFLRSITEQEEGVLASLRWLQPPRKRTNVNLWSLLFWLQPQKGDEITPKFCG